MRAKRGPRRGPRVLLVFLKAPDLGRVKTRLAADIGPSAACRAYLAMARRVRDSVAELKGARVVWVYDPSPAHPGLAWLGKPSGEVWRQSKGDLGRRLAGGFARAFAEGAREACAIGVDTPDLASAALRQAFAVLARRELVLGPSADGGYYLIGLRRFCPELFQRISWSTSRVLAQTRSRAARLHLRLGTLSEGHDVDTAADLVRWLRS